MSNETLLSRSMQAVWHPCTQMKQHEDFPLLAIIGVMACGFMMPMVIAI